MTTSPRSLSSSVWDVVGYVALVLIAVVAGFLYFQDTTSPEPVALVPVAPRVITHPEGLFDRLSRQAHAGDVVSQRQLGQMYLSGMEVRADDAEALKWLRMAGDKGDKLAARLLGSIYAGGRGVTVNHSEAVSWWKLAADKGDDQAAFSLALAYLKGNGVAESKAEGVRYCQLAAQRGDPRAQFFLGHWSYHGTLLPESHQEAYAWFRKSAVQGSAWSQNWLGVMYREGHSVDQNDAEAVRWFQFAVNHGSGDGCLNLSQMYFKGRGVAKDESKALAILQKGAMLEHPLSQSELARRLAMGDGAPVDPVEACAWYDLSVRGGNTDAKPARDAAYRTLSAAQVSSARARASALSAQIETEKALRTRAP